MKNFKRELKKIVLAMSSSVLILGSAVNLKDYHASFDLLDLSAKTLCAPLLFMACIGLGIYLGGKYIKMESTPRN